MLLGLTLLATGLAAEVRSKRSEGKKVITVDSPECEVSEKVLYCDYKGSKEVRTSSAEELLYIGPLQNSQIQTVFLNDIKELYLDECVSVDISATRIKKISIEPSENFNCSNFALSVKYSSISEVPRVVSQLYIEGCNVDILKPRMPLSKLLVISSGVQQLEVAVPLAKGTVGIIHSSEIVHFKRYTTDSGSTLTIKDTKIDNLSPDAFEMRDGKIIVENSTLTGAACQIKGSFTMTPVVKATTTTIKSDIPGQSCEQRDNTYYYLFCVLLFLFVVSWVAFVAYLFHNKILMFFAVISTPDQPKEGPVENEHLPLVTLPLRNTERTESDNERYDTVAACQFKTNDKITTRIEMLSSQFDKDKERHAQDVKGYESSENRRKISENDADICKIKDCMRDHSNHMEKLDETERNFEDLICGIILGTWNGNRNELKSGIESETGLEKEGPVSEDPSDQGPLDKVYIKGLANDSGNSSDPKIGGTGLCAGRSTKSVISCETMRKELDEAVDQCLSQVDDRLSYLRCGQPDDSLSPKLKKSWKKKKDKKKVEEMFKHTQAKIKDDILNLQVSTFKILVRFQEHRIEKMKNNTKQFTI
ncbi:uncharacterized protein LOC135215506 isoform X2 [Macrobrachium nipponense]